MTTKRTTFMLLNFVLPLCAAASLSAFSAPASTHTSRPLQTGWHEEFGESSVGNWYWNQTQSRAIVSAPNRGSMRVTLGENSTGDVTGKVSWSWATCSRIVSVDLDKYPVLAVRVIGISGEGRTWWDVFVNDYKGGNTFGPDICGRLGTGYKPGLLMFDATNGGKLKGNRQVRIRLNIASMNHGAYADYAYVRFISKRDQSRLRKNPGLKNVLP